MRSAIIRYSLSSLLFAMAMTCAFAGRVWAQDFDAPVELSVGKSAELAVDADIATTVVDDPAVAEATLASSRSFILRGKRSGATTAIAYNPAGSIVNLIEIEVTPSVEGLQEELKRNLPGETIHVSQSPDGLLLNGAVKSAGAATLALLLAEQHFPGGVIDSLSVAQGQRVLLEVRFLEASRNAVRELGFRNAGEAVNLTTSTDGGATTGDAGRTIALFTNSGGETIDQSIGALERTGVVRTLAEPNLVKVSGDTATYLAGGEVELPMANANNEIVLQTGLFGLNLDLTPTVLGDGLMSLRVRAAVSVLDRAIGTTVSGIEVPGVALLGADTTVELRAGQALAVTELLQRDASNDVRQTAWLGNLPVLGSLFASRRFQRDESELIIIITPRLQ